VYRQCQRGYWRASKRWCKALPPEGVNKALLRFANNEAGLRPADVYGGARGAIAQLKELEAWFQARAFAARPIWLGRQPVLARAHALASGASERRAWRLRQLEAVCVHWTPTAGVPSVWGGVQRAAGSSSGSAGCHSRRWKHESGAEGRVAES